MRAFNINDNAHERDIELAHGLLASAYPGAIWRHVREDHGDHAAIYLAAFVVDCGAVAIAALDPESGDVNVIPMTEADPDLYQLVALVFASEIGKWMARAARSLGQRQTIAPSDDICQAFVESVGETAPLFRQVDEGRRMNTAMANPRATNERLRRRGR